MYKKRKQYRLPNYDYSRCGWYFVTICTKGRRCWFGEIEKGQACLSEIGEIARQELIRACGMRKNAKLDAFIIMPNHVHAIIVIGDGSDNFCRNTPRRVPTEMEMPKDDIIAPRRVPTEMEMPKDDTIAPRRVPTKRGIPKKDSITPRRVPIEKYGRPVDSRHTRNENTNFGTIGPLGRDSLSSVVNQYKGAVKRWCNQNGYGRFRWQARFHDTIIWDKESLDKIREYICANRWNWKGDRNNLNKVGK